jgi:hypothetical protein
VIIFVAFCCIQVLAKDFYLKDSANDKNEKCELLKI